MLQFKQFGEKPGSEFFKELSFCLLTANFNAKRSMEIQRVLGNGFLTLTKKELAKKLKILGHRFPEARAKYIIEARKHLDSLKENFASFQDENDLREWIAKNIKGLGYKEASHFLRNIGYENFAIIDFHIIELLVTHKLIEKPKTLTKNKYLEIENLLKDIAEKSGLNLAELDLYLWYMETGKVLK